jgi:hypothetical protein
VFKYNFADRVNRIVLLTIALLVLAGIIAVPVSGLASVGQIAYMVGAVCFALYFMVSECFFVVKAHSAMLACTNVSTLL